MRFLLRFCMLCLLFASFNAAKADPLDFNLNVLDPNVPTDFINASPFGIGISSCVAGELPAGLTADGCFAGENNTTTPWNGLQIVVPYTEGVVGQAASCTLDSSVQIFQNASCALDPALGAFVLTFSSGIIAPDSVFVIAEDGVPAGEFPDSIGTFSTVTPEPSSILLMGTGLICLGLLSLSKREA